MPIFIEAQGPAFYLLLLVAGAILGGALAHWQRGRGMVLTGALIGLVALPLAAYGATLYAGVVLAIAVVGALASVLLSILG